MKINIEEQTRPITITFETQEEIDQLYAMLNFTPIGQAIKKDDSDWRKIWNFLCCYKSSNYLFWHSRLNRIKEEI